MFVMDHVFEEGICFEGQYRVAKVGHKYTRYHNPYMIVHLQDITGIIPAYCWYGRYHGPKQLSTHDIVHVCGTMNSFLENWQVSADSLEVLKESDINPSLLVPVDICPRRDLLVHLARAVDQISAPSLQRFVKRILNDDEIMSRFATVPASGRYHHNYPSGTLEHSLECVEVVQRMPGLNNSERDLAVVAALFHDIGKIRTNKIGGMTQEGFWVHHNALTCEILGDHLKSLDCDWPDAAYVLRHIWSFLHKGPTQSRSSLAGLVAYADQYSAERAQEKAAFADQKTWKTAVKDLNGNLRMRLREAA
ncbi:MAG: HD domain-containing protein [Desulfobacteraceae bacterium]|nr:HD domain-containing protein [Desulfobacteraceae bacterium]